MKHIRIHLLIIIGIFIHTSLKAQLNIGGKPYSFDHENISRSIETKRLPSLDMVLVREEDRRDEARGLPPRFGYPFEVDYNLYNSGNWQELENGDRLWQLTISCPNAKSINLLYDAFWLPKGATLYIYNADKSHIIGGFTSRNNNSEQGEYKGFATGLVFGDQITLEYYEPADVMNQGELSIAKVVHGYRYINLDVNEQSRELGASGPCNVNINCEEGQDWQNEKRGVALILVSGIRWCSGSLVNNTSGELAPYFLTADHCLVNLDAVDNPNASTWSFYWDYESPDCTQPRRNRDIPFSVTSGAVVLASNAVSDFALLRLTEDPIDLKIPLSYNGWDARGNPVESVVGIHHPSGDIKKISIELDPIISTAYDRDTEDNKGTCWKVRDWDIGVTEGGSSGSPLFDGETRMILGQLWGGDAACNGSNDNNRADWYGKFSVSWTGNGNSNQKRRLSDWLDPSCKSISRLSADIQEEHPIIQSSDQIDISNKITANASVVILSGERITFKPGFRAKKGSYLKAKIAGCGLSRSVSENSIHFQGAYALPSEETKLFTTNIEKAEENLKIQALRLSVAPNPFSSSTSINFSVPTPTKLTIELRNHLGQLTRTIVASKSYQAGEHSLSLSRNKLPAGIYYCMLRSDKHQVVQKVVVGQ